MITLVENGEVYAPEPRGRQSVLLVGERIAHIGAVERGPLLSLPVTVQIVDASGLIVAPGIVDPHSHLIGTGGEQGYASRTPEVPFEELVKAGITTVVGCLGTDDNTRFLGSLIGRARQLQRLGISAYAYSGSFYLPPPTLMKNVREDLLFIPEFLGVGELAISDFRSNEPSLEELTRLASECLVGGLLGEKAGVVHFHVGPGKARLKLLRDVIDHSEVPPRHLYPTHINRSEELMDEAIELSMRGCYVDSDTIEPHIAKWIRRYLDGGGAPERLTLSSDSHAPKASPAVHRERLLQALLEDGLPFQTLLPLVTKNPADAVKLGQKGRLEVGADADLMILQPRTYALRDVYARGKALMRSGVVLG